MSDKVTEETKSKMSTKKKVILILVVLGLLGGSYYGTLWLEAKNHGIEIKDLPEKRALWNEKIKQERF